MTGFEPGSSGILKRPCCQLCLNHFPLVKSFIVQTTVLHLAFMCPQQHWSQEWKLFQKSQLASVALKRKVILNTIQTWWTSICVDKKTRHTVCVCSERTFYYYYTYLRWVAINVCQALCFISVTIPFIKALCKKIFFPSIAITLRNRFYLVQKNTKIYRLLSNFLQICLNQGKIYIGFRWIFQLSKLKFYFHGIY